MHEKREKILEEALKLVPFDGWNNATLRAATKNAGLPPAYEQVAFHGGVIDVIALFLNKIDTDIFNHIDADALKGMKIRERIFTILNTRLTIMTKYKSIVQKTLQFLAMPQNIVAGTKLLWAMADKAWYMAGDTAVDFNYYTKRTTLMALYSATLLYWLNDKSKKHHDTEIFLKERIDNVMQFEKFKGKVKEMMGKVVG